MNGDYLERCFHKKFFWQKRSSQHTFFPVSQIATKNSDESLVQLGICR